jgi:hypothetical protein
MYDGFILASATGHQSPCLIVWRSYVLINYLSIIGLIDSYQNTHSQFGLLDALSGVVDMPVPETKTYIETGRKHLIQSTNYIFD